MTSLPAHELDLFLNSVTAAVDLARQGYPAAGFQDLWYALERARVEGEGEEWGRT